MSAEASNYSVNFELILTSLGHLGQIHDPLERNDGWTNATNVHVECTLFLNIHCNMFRVYLITQFKIRAILTFRLYTFTKVIWAIWTKIDSTTSVMYLLFQLSVKYIIYATLKNICHS